MAVSTKQPVLLRTWSGLGPMKGWQRSFQPLMKARILIIRSRTDGKLPRWMAWRSLMENQISTGSAWWIQGLHDEGQIGPSRDLLAPVIHASCLGACVQSDVEPYRLHRRRSG
jgi:hypothetical protein